MRSFTTALFVVVCLSGLAHAQSTENSARACRDGLDNDEDGYIDCADQNCHAFVFCAPPEGSPSEASAAPQQEDQSPGLLLGVSLFPGGMVLAGGGLSLDAAGFGGVGIALRVGYQIRDWVGVIVEPWFAAMGAQNTLVMPVGGSVQVDFRIRRLLLGIGPAVGGFAICLFSYATGEPGCGRAENVAGGLVFKIGGEAIRKRHAAGVSVFSIAADVRPLVFRANTGATAATITLGVAFGYDFVRVRR